MTRIKHTIGRSFIGAVAMVALALATLGGPGPAARADGGVYPRGVYGPGGTCCFALTNWWGDGGGVGFAGHEVYTFSNGPDASSSIANWRAGGLDPNTLYDVCAYIPDNNANANATYSFVSKGGDSGPIIVNQEAYTNQWAFIGLGYPTSDGHIDVSLSDRSDDPAFTTVVGADAMMFIPDYNDTIGPVQPGDTDNLECTPYFPLRPGD